MTQTAQTDKSEIKHVVVVGGGFGGLRVAKALRKAPVRITLIDRANHHLFQPLLYQVATAGLSAEEIATPIRSVLRNQDNVRVLLGEVHSADLVAQRIKLKDGAEMAYDYLVVAAGTQTNHYGHDDWQKHTVGLKDLEDAFELRRRVLIAFEAAERSDDADERRRLLTFCVIGGGPTGVEMAGSISELSRSILQRDFRSISGDMIRVVLVEMGARVLAGFEPRLSAQAAKDLAQLGVEVRTQAGVTKIDATGVTLGDEHICSSVICWAAGVKPRPLASRLGLPVNRRGAVDVQPDCSLGAFKNAFAIGDIATFVPAGKSSPLPGLAPVAMQQAANVAANIQRDLKGQPRKPFVYFDKGIMATIGTSRAVLQYGKFRMSGFLAWMAWIFVHVYYIIGFRNRTLVMFNWFWAYVTKRRGARLIPQSRPQFPQQAGDSGPQTPERRREDRAEAPPKPVAESVLVEAPVPVCTTAWRPQRSLRAPFH
jgi:NADH dehydrogenase